MDISGNLKYDLPSQVMNVIYIAKHIRKIQTIQANQPSAIEDSLWRIASNAELFWNGNNNNLNSDGTLSDQQRQKVWQFINKFKSSSEGQEALKLFEKSR